MLYKSLILITLSTVLLHSRSAEAQKACLDIFSYRHHTLVPDRLAQSLLQLTQKGSLDFKDVETEVYAALTGFSPTLIQTKAMEPGFVYKLVPIQSFQRTINRTHWEGHVYTKQDSIFKSRIFNSFWGRPFNIHPLDPVGLVINQEAGSRRVWMNMVLGYSRLNSEQMRNLQQQLSAMDRDLSLRQVELGPNKDTSILILAGLTTSPTHLNLTSRLIDTLQDRLLSADD